MKIYITASFGDTKEEIENLCMIVRNAGLEDFCFIRDVENYQKVFDDPKELMQKGLETIKDCDALLIDMTDKPTGRALEAGMAYALGKPVIVIMKKGTQIKDTTRGIANVVIEYNEIADLSEALKKWLNNQ